MRKMVLEKPYPFIKNFSPSPLKEGGLKEVRLKICR